MTARHTAFRIEQTLRTEQPPLESDSTALNQTRRLFSCFEHDLIRKPVSTFRDHALAAQAELAQAANIAAALTALRRAARTASSRTPRRISDDDAPADDVRGLAELKACTETTMQRVLHELQAVAEDGERATVLILDAAESIDDLIKTLAAGLRHRQEQAAAADIQDHLTRLFEACNFQDLGGQRIVKVVAALTALQRHIAGIEARRAGRSQRDASQRDASVMLHGPKLDSDQGHISQREIDIIFAAG